ncbi:MAG: hypothetical protein KDA78_16095 [Planctomycetaceae bacterium]|nr:hypothetical protein [Planctomycetaceae bacterium]
MSFRIKVFLLSVMVLLVLASTCLFFLVRFSRVNSAVAFSKYIECSLHYCCNMKQVDWDDFLSRANGASWRTLALEGMCPDNSTVLFEDDEALIALDNYDFTQSWEAECNVAAITNWQERSRSIVPLSQKYAQVFWVSNSSTSINEQEFIIVYFPSGNPYFWSSTEDSVLRQANGRYTLKNGTALKGKVLRQFTVGLSYHTTESLPVGVSSD